MMDNPLLMSSASSSMGHRRTGDSARQGWPQKNPVAMRNVPGFRNKNLGERKGAVTTGDGNDRISGDAISGALAFRDCHRSGCPRVTNPGLIETHTSTSAREHQWNGVTRSGDPRKPSAPCHHIPPDIL